MAAQAEASARSPPTPITTATIATAAGNDDPPPPPEPLMSSTPIASGGSQFEQTAVGRQLQHPLNKVASCIIKTLKYLYVPNVYIIVLKPYLLS